MKPLYRVLILALLCCAYPLQAAAQAMCVLPQGGSCPMGNAGPPGSPCYCATPGGPLFGATFYQNTSFQNPDPWPHFCCTPAGRLGPFQNGGIPAGGQCFVGRMIGQACY